MKLLREISTVFLFQAYRKCLNKNAGNGKNVVMYIVKFPSGLRILWICKQFKLSNFLNNY